MCVWMCITFFILIYSLLCVIVCSGAYKWWLESLDLLLGGKNVIHKWRQLLSRSPDISATLLQKCGLWGCILGAVLAANIAQ